MGGHRRGPSWVRVGGLVAVIALAVAGGWWAGRATFTAPAAAAAQQQTQVSVTVTRASVGQTVRLNVTVTQAYQPLAPVLLSGIVTDVPSAGAVEVGQVMFRVDDVPVRVVEGATPFYRDLAAGATGADVSELQQALVTLGFLAGAPSGAFDAATAAAVEKWQASLGQPATGEVALGELIAVPTLPMTLRLGDGVSLGAQVGPGQPAVLARVGDPEFRLVVSQQQAQLIPSAATVQISFKDRTWPAVITETATDPNSSSTLVMSLASPSGGLPCGDECAELPPDDSLSLLSSIEVVPQTTGTAVPAAAVHTAADGGTYVLMQDDSRRPVTVKASSNGLVIVDGVAEGESVWALGDSDSDSAVAPGGDGRSGDVSAEPTG